MSNDEFRKRHTRAQFIAAVPYGEIEAADRASADDRRYFEDHPDETVRFRALLPGEFGDHIDEGDVAFVRVDKVSASSRIRSTVCWLKGALERTNHRVARALRRSSGQDRVPEDHNEGGEES